MTAAGEARHLVETLKTSFPSFEHLSDLPALRGKQNTKVT